MGSATPLIKGIPIVIQGADERGQRIGGQLVQLIDTLRRLPRLHLEHVPPITVGMHPEGGGGGYAYPGQYAGQPYGFIRLHFGVFNAGERPWNRGRVNVSLLHEIGHVIDWAFQCTRHLGGADQRILYDPGYDGATHGPGEHFAQAYSKFYSDPPTLTEARQEVLLRSRAFENVDFSE
jgi:hypothetical protein